MTRPFGSAAALLILLSLWGCSEPGLDRDTPPPAEVPMHAWPGPGEVRVVDRGGVFGENLSGVHLEAFPGDAALADPPEGVLWAVLNWPSTLFRLVRDGSDWIPDPADGWGEGRPLRYPDGSGDPDAEGVVRVVHGPWAGVYVATERDNDHRGVSRNAVLRFDPDAAAGLASGEALVATHAWDLNALLPTTGPNLGIEAITWIPASFLVAAGFRERGAEAPWTPGPEAREGGGLFAVGLEATGEIFFLVLDHLEGRAHVVDRVPTHMDGVMALHFDADTGELWAACDDNCSGRMAVLAIEAGEAGVRVVRYHDPPAALPELNHEGFTLAPLSWCRNGARPAWWTDDDESGGVAIRKGWMNC